MCTLGRKWPITSLGYSVYNYPARALSRSAVARIIRRAFKVFVSRLFSVNVERLLDLRERLQSKVQDCFMKTSQSWSL